MFVQHSGIVLVFLCFPHHFPHFHQFSTSNPHQTGESAFDDLPRQDVPIHVHQEISQAPIHGTPFEGKGERKVEKNGGKLNWTKMEGKAWESTLSSVFVDVSFLSLLDAPLYLFAITVFTYVYPILSLSTWISSTVNTRWINSRGGSLGRRTIFRANPGKPQFHVPCFNMFHSLTN